MQSVPGVGSQLAGYRLESLIRRGGMGVVYLAEDFRLGRRVAIKVLAPELASDERFRERFVRESHMAAAIDHPNVIPIYDAGEADGVLYIVMRYVPGTDLAAILAREPRLSVARALSIVSQAAEGLDAAHAAGLVHRDVKPANVLVTPSSGPEAPEHVYLTDFGLTKRSTSESGITRTGQFLGTVEYVAPEQIEGGHVDGRTDLYSLGCMAYQCLTGSVPLAKGVDAATLYAHLHESPAPASFVAPELPVSVDAVLSRAMAIRADDRYARCLEFVGALRAALAGPPAGSRPGDTTRTAVVGGPNLPPAPVFVPTPEQTLVAPAATWAAGGPPPGAPPWPPWQWEQGGARARRPSRPGGGRTLLVALIVLVVAAAIGGGVLVATRRKPAPVAAPTTPASSPSRVQTSTTPGETPSPTPSAQPSTPAGGLPAAVAKVQSLGFTVTDQSAYSPDFPLHVLLGMCSGSADGYCQQAFFFYGDHYLGLDLSDPSAGIQVAWRDDLTVALRYILYNSADPMCCPTGGAAVVRFHWDGAHVVALDPIPSTDARR